MRREVGLHLTAVLGFFLLTALVKRLSGTVLLEYYVGGILGTVLPDLDHIIYALYLKPQETVSKSVNNLLRRGEIKSTINLLVVTRNERKQLIFHTSAFQAFFL